MNQVAKSKGAPCARLGPRSPGTKRLAHFTALVLPAALQGTHFTEENTGAPKCDPENKLGGQSPGEKVLLWRCGGTYWTQRLGWGWGISPRPEVLKLHLLNPQSPLIYGTEWLPHTEATKRSCSTSSCGNTDFFHTHTLRWGN